MSSRRMARENEVKSVLHCGGVSVLDDVAVFECVSS